ncbi:hypothetical protein [Histophilus somni]|nr:hypothetical protein [Histophilus somni]ACA32246.1 hypothetical protein HSM_0593 [Histophilus somni 2336]
MMKTITPIDVHGIRFDYDTNDPITCLLENQPTLADRIALKVMNEEGISWDTLPQSLESQDDSNDMLLHQPYDEKGENKEIEPTPYFSLAYAHFQVQKKIQDIDSVMEVFESPIISNEVDKYWLDRAFIGQKAMMNTH